MRVVCGHLYAAFPHTHMFIHRRPMFYLPISGMLASFVRYSVGFR